MGWEGILDERDLRLYLRNIPLLCDQIAAHLSPEECDAPLLAALRRVPRHLFVAREYAALAYTDNALPTSGGLTTSAPSVTAAMIHYAGLRPGDRVLEIGTGTGYEAAVLAEMGARVFTIEIDPLIARAAGEVLGRLGYASARGSGSVRGPRSSRGAGGAARNRRRDPAHLRRGEVELVEGNGLRGLPDRAPFRAIIVAASARSLEVVRPLVAQLAAGGGRLVAPIGEPREQHLYLIERGRAGYRTSRVADRSFAFVRMYVDGRE